MVKIVYNNFKLKIKFEKAFHSEAVLNHFFNTFFADFRLCNCPHFLSLCFKLKKQDSYKLGPMSPKSIRHNMTIAKFFRYQKSLYTNDHRQVFVHSTK